MADYPATSIGSTAGTTVTERTGAASGDTVPGGSYVLVRNAGAGTHVITFTNSATQDGLTIASRTLTVAAGTVAGIRINPAWADGSGLVAVAIDATATEVKYYVIAPN